MYEGSYCFPVYMLLSVQYENIHLSNNDPQSREYKTLNSLTAYQRILNLKIANGFE
jgi:hypothetical protein